MKTYLKLVLATVILGSSTAIVCESTQSTPATDWEKRAVQNTLGAAKAITGGCYIGFFFGACFCAGVSLKRLAVDHEQYDTPDALYDWMQLGVSILTMPALLHFAGKLIKSSQKSFQKANAKPLIT